MNTDLRAIVWPAFWLQTGDGAICEELQAEDWIGQFQFGQLGSRPIARWTATAIAGTTVGRRSSKFPHCTVDRQNR
jgi:hypothetical protein